PGDTLIVPSEYGGADRFGWNPVEKSPVEDVGDLAALLARGKPVLRIHPSVVAAWQPPPDGDQPPLSDRIRVLLNPSVNEEEDVDLLSETDPDAPAGDDPNSFCSPSRPVTLGDHCNAVGELARRSAAAIGLPEAIVDSLEFAGKLHDLGKLDPRFQAWLC